jgi:hypothetical protein
VFHLKYASTVEMQRMQATVQDMNKEARIKEEADARLQVAEGLTH